MMIRIISIIAVLTMMSSEAIGQKSNIASVKKKYFEIQGGMDYGNTTVHMASLDSLLKFDLSNDPDLEANILKSKALIHLRTNELLKARACLDKGLALIEDSKNDTLKLQFNYQQGNSYWLSNDYKEAIKYHKRASEIAEKLENDGLNMGILYALVFDYQRINEPDSAEITNVKYFKLAQEHSDTLEMIYSLRFSAINFEGKRNFANAGDYYARAFYLAKEFGHKELVQSIGYNYALFYYTLGNLDLSLERLNEFIDGKLENSSYNFLSGVIATKAEILIKLHKFSEAENIITSTLKNKQIFATKEDSLYAEAIQSLIKYHKKDYTSAKILFNQIFQSKEDIYSNGHPSPLIESLLCYGEFSFINGETEKLQEILNFLESLKTLSYPQQQALYELKSKIAEKNKNYRKSLKYLRQKESITDSIAIMYTGGALIAKEQEVRDEMQLKEIQYLSQQNQLKDSENKFKNRAILFLALASLLGLLLLFIWGRHRKIKLESTLTEVKQRLLKLQINPHFIFNVLNSIQNSVLTLKKEKSVELISKFSALTRSVLQNSDKAMVSIQEELSLLTNYMDLEKVRTQNKFDYEVEIGENIDVYNEEVPSMILQLFVENSIWHGILPKDEKGLIKIGFHKENQKIKVCVEDNGIGRKLSANFKSNGQKEKKSMGMDLVKRRINALNKKYKSNIKMNITDGPDGLGTLVYLVA